MLSRLLFVRLKAAENALRDGRLDEAYRLATAPDIREHRRGSAVLSALTKRFVERARGHFRADRFTEALMDLDRAAAGGVMQEEIAELRQHIQTVAAEQRRRDQSRCERIEAAKQRIEDGSLAGGQRILKRAGERDADAERLRRVIDERAENAEGIAEQAETLITQGQLAAAAKRLRRAMSIDAHNASAARVERRLCDQVLQNARDALTEGKLSRASDELACLGSLGNALPARKELADLLATALEASRCVQNGLYRQAVRHAMSLSRLLPRAKWVHTAVQQLRQMNDIVTTLSAGPLGNHITVPASPLPQRGVEQCGADRAQDGPAPPANSDDTVALPRAPYIAGGLPDRLLLLVDGGGSYLLLRSPQAAIGRVVSRNPADVPIFGDVAERHANVTRVDDDYFLFSAKEVEIGGKKTRHQLLRDGDRIVLGRKAKMTFRLPTRKSPTAVLDLSDTTKMPNDVRRVILFHQHAMVGAGPNAHIRCRHAGTPVVLFERGGALWMRRKNDGHVDTEPVRLTLGEPIEIAGISLVLEPWRVRTPGSGEV